jgi:hypothetical protein
LQKGPDRKYGKEGSGPVDNRKRWGIENEKFVIDHMRMEI